MSALRWIAIGMALGAGLGACAGRGGTLATAPDPKDVTRVWVYGSFPDDAELCFEIPPIIAHGEAVIWQNSRCIGTLYQWRLLARRGRRAD